MSDDPPVYSCEDCGEEMVGRYDYWVHRGLVHDDPRSPVASRERARIRRMAAAKEAGLTAEEADTSADCEFHPEAVIGDDVTIWLPEFSIYGTGADLEAAKADLIEDVRDYVAEYLDEDDDTLRSAPNRRDHYPYALRVRNADLDGCLTEVLFANLSVRSEEPLFAALDAAENEEIAEMAAERKVGRTNSFVELDEVMEELLADNARLRELLAEHEPFSKLSPPPPPGASDQETIDYLIRLVRYLKAQWREAADAASESTGH